MPWFWSRRRPDPAKNPTLVPSEVYANYSRVRDFFQRAETLAKRRNVPIGEVIAELSAQETRPENTRSVERNAPTMAPPDLWAFALISMDAIPAAPPEPHIA